MMVAGSVGREDGRAGSKKDEEDGLFVVKIMDNEKGGSLEEDDLQALQATKKRVNPCVAWMRNHPRKACGMLTLVLILVAVPMAWVLDLALADMDQFQANRIEVDVSQVTPKAQVELVLEHGARWSSVEPTGMRCTFDQAGGAALNIQVTRLGEAAEHAYLLDMTCPEGDVEAHANLLWDVLAKQQPVGAYTCSVDVSGKLGNFIPFSKTMDLSGETITKALKQLAMRRAEQDKETHKKQDDGSTISKDQEEELAQGQAVVVRELSTQTVEVAVRLELPKWVFRLAPTIRVVLPPLTLEANIASSGRGSRLTMDGVEATFLQHSPNQGNIVTFALTNTKANDQDKAPWFGPLLDLTGSSHTTVHVTVQAGKGSFLETLLGHSHNVVVEFNQQDISQAHAAVHSRRGLVSSVNEREDRKPTSSSSLLLGNRKLQGTADEATANCMRVSGEGGELGLGVGMCWRFSVSDGLTFLGDMSLYDAFSGTIYSETTWDVVDSSVEIVTTADVELGANRQDEMSITNNLVVDWANNIIITMNLDNEGPYKPFKGIMQWEGTAASDELSGATILNFAMNEGSFRLEEELKVDATASVTIDTGDQSFTAVMSDPPNNWDGETKARIVGGALVGNSRMTVGGEDVWNAVMEGRTITSDNGDISFHSFVRDPENLIFEQGWSVMEDGNHFTSNSSLTLGSEQLWNQMLDMKISPSLTDPNATRIAIELEDPWVDYRMTLAGEGKDVVDVVVSFVLDSLTFLYKQEQYVDATGEFRIQDASVAFTAANTVQSDFSTDWLLSWAAPTESSFSATLEKGVMTVDGETIVDIPVGQFSGGDTGNGVSASLTVNSNPAARLQVGTDVSFDIAAGDVVTLAWQDMLYAWGDYRYWDMDGNFVLDLGAATADMTMVDETALGFDAIFKVTWDDAVGNSGWGGYLEQAKIVSLVGGETDETFVDWSMSMEFDPNSMSGNPVGTVKCETATDTSPLLLMNMDMTFTWFQEDAVLSVVFDHLKLGWDASVFINAPSGDTPPAVSDGGEEDGGDDGPAVSDGGGETVDPSGDGDDGTQVRNQGSGASRGPLGSGGLFTTFVSSLAALVAASTWMII